MVMRQVKGTNAWERKAKLYIDSLVVLSRVTTYLMSVRVRACVERDLCEVVGDWAARLLARREEFTKDGKDLGRRGKG